MRITTNHVFPTGAMICSILALGWLGCGGDDGASPSSSQDAGSPPDSGLDAADASDAAQEAHDAYDAADDVQTESSAEAGSPLDLPLLAIADFLYQGAFRVPASDYGTSSMNYSEGPFAYDPVAHSVFIVGHNHQQSVAEFSVPELVNSTVIAELNMADDPSQVFVSLLDRVAANPEQMDRIGGMALVEGPSGRELVVNVYEYYDAPADDTHTTLVVRDPTDLSGSDVDGFFALQGAAHTSGWISPIPSAWQPLLGGTHITGNSSGMPIIGRLTVGPSAFVFDPLDIVGTTNPPGGVATTALLDFSLDHPLHDDLSNDGGDNDLWTHLSRAVYGFIAPGTRTYVTVGHTGGHATGVCYKCTPTGATDACGGYCANDVTDYAHAYWLWDIRDLVAVGEGTMNPWEARPYEYGPFPTPFATRELGGGAFDAASGLLYLTVQRADTEQGTYANPPIVVAYRLSND